MATDYEINTYAQATGIHVGADDEGRKFLSLALDAGSDALVEHGHDLDDPTVRNGIDTYIWESITGNQHTWQADLMWQTWADLRLWTSDPTDHASEDMTGTATAMLIDAGRRVAMALVEDEAADWADDEDEED